jgi:hypothetical protein
LAAFATARAAGTTFAARPRALGRSSIARFVAATWRRSDKQRDESPGVEPSR